MYKLDFYTAISNRNDPKTLNHFERVSGYGQVVRTPRGREVTEKAYKHLGILRSKNTGELF